MKKRKRFSLTWLALLALAGGLELLLVDGTLSCGAPLLKLASGVRETLDRTGTSTASAQPMYIWKDASGVTHIGEKPPSAPPSGAVRELQITPDPAVPQPAPVPPEPVAPPVAQQPPAEPPAAAPPTAAGEAAQDAERLHRERAQLEKQLYRARAKGDGYAQIRLRNLLETNRQALEKLTPQQ